MSLPLNLTSFAAIIPAGGSLSPAVPMGAMILCAVVMPAAWTAASLTWQVSADGGVTWQEMQDGAGNAITNTVSAGIAFGVNNTLWSGFNMVKVRSGTLASPVAQPTAATITLQAQPLLF